MFGLVNVVGALGLYIGQWVVVRYGVKVALIAAVIAVFATIWTAMMGLIATAVAVMPASPLTPFALQFLPSSTAIATGAGIVVSTAITLKSLEWWRMTWGVTSKLAS